jgi:hypothetical protein
MYALLLLSFYLICTSGNSWDLSKALENHKPADAQAGIPRDVVATAVRFDNAFTIKGDKGAIEMVEIWLQSLRLSGYSGRILFLVCGTKFPPGLGEYLKKSGAEVRFYLQAALQTNSLILFWHSHR